jgi:hypothetical protein
MLLLIDVKTNQVFQWKKETWKMMPVVESLATWQYVTRDWDKRCFNGRRRVERWCRSWSLLQHGSMWLMTETRLTVMKCCAIKSDVKIDLFLVINHCSGHFRQWIVIVQNKQLVCLSIVHCQSHVQKCNSSGKEWHQVMFMKDMCCLELTIDFVIKRA